MKPRMADMSAFKPYLGTGQESDGTNVGSSSGMRARWAAIHS
jgi:hypothetical protein